MIKKEDIREIHTWAKTIIDAVEKVFFGKREVIEKILVSLLCGGHVLIEDVPGVGKTILARAIAVSLGGEFRRIQCTPDLLPADVIGISVYDPNKAAFTFHPGPILSNVVLVDEINRATPRTQSALLEAMAENQISVEGKPMALPAPFFLMATENPIEFEGTFPLPEAQKDRFFMGLKIGYPSRNAESLILETQRRTTHPVCDLKPAAAIDSVLDIQNIVVNVTVDESLRDYILDIAEASRKNPLFQLGISPRGSLALYKGAQALAALRGRDFVTPEDIKELAVPVLSKRVILKSEQLVKGITGEAAVTRLLDSVDIKVMKDAAE
ncbi:MAG: MoxR family ATPase [Spirochaetales bacterium]|nr:MoxR family ATPase [Spirochaetales bacterium]